MTTPTATQHLHAPAAAGDRPPVTVLCGSTRYPEAYRRAMLLLTLAGHIVVSIGCNLRTDTDPELHPGDDDTRQLIKQRLDELHLRKIDLADRVYVLNVGGYIGYSTRREIEYATASGKPIEYLEPTGGGTGA